MTFVSNTSPLNYLVLIDSVTVLPALSNSIYVPAQVIVELAAEGSP